VGDEGFLEAIVDRWRSSSSAAASDASQSMAMFADAMNIAGPAQETPAAQRDVRPNGYPPPQPGFGLPEGARPNGMRRREDQASPRPAAPAPAAAPSDTLRSIRERLQQR
jgi:hypothetical protein